MAVAMPDLDMTALLFLPADPFRLVEVDMVADIATTIVVVAIESFPPRLSLDS